MTVNELIEKLSTFPGDLPVMTVTEDLGVEDIWEVVEETHTRWSSSSEKRRGWEHYRAVVIR